MTQLRYICYFKETTLLNVINYQDFFYGISLPDIHLDLVFINDVLICQKKNPLPKSRLQGKCGRKCVGPKKKYVCLRSPDPPYFSAADPNLFYRQLFHPNFC